jgi:hypothetical protein
MYDLYRIEVIGKSHSSNFKTAQKEWPAYAPLKKLQMIQNNKYEFPLHYPKTTRAKYTTERFQRL